MHSKTGHFYLFLHETRWERAQQNKQLRLRTNMKSQFHFSMSKHPAARLSKFSQVFEACKAGGGFFDTLFARGSLEPCKFACFLLIQLDCLKIFYKYSKSGFMFDPAVLCRSEFVRARGQVLICCHCGKITAGAELNTSLSFFVVQCCLHTVSCTDALALMLYHFYYLSRTFCSVHSRLSFTVRLLGFIYLILGFAESEVLTEPNSLYVYVCGCVSSRISWQSVWPV